MRSQIACAFFALLGLHLWVQAAPSFGDAFDAQMKRDDVEREFMANATFDAHKYGMIGVKVDYLRTKLNESTMPEITGDCQWRGQAPFCDDWRTCPSPDYKITRESDTPYHYADNPEEWDETFGKPCWSRNKIFCCRQGTEDPTWAGMWRSVETSRFMECSYDASMGFCGGIHCTENGGTYSSSIGEDCTRIKLKEQPGKVENGLIRLKNETYYKVALPTWKMESEEPIIE